MEAYPIEPLGQNLHSLNNDAYYTIIYSGWQADQHAPAIDLPDMNELYKKYGVDRLEGLDGIYVPEDAFAHVYAESLHIQRKDDYQVFYRPGVNILFSAVCPRCDDLREVVLPTRVALSYPQIQFIRAAFTFPCHPNMEQFMVKFFKPLVIDPQNIEYPDTRTWAQKRFDGLRRFLPSRENQLKAVTGKTERLTLEE